MYRPSLKGSSMYRPSSKGSFEELLAKHATLHTIQCLQINHDSKSQPLTICSYNNDASRAMVVTCPEGGISFQMRKGWYQESNTMHVKAETARHEIARAFVMVAKQSDWTFGAMTVIADRIRMQSSVHPLDLHSFCTQKNGLTLRCPKGGVSISSGQGGVQCNTSGNIEYNLDRDRSQVRIASRGNKKHTILLGNAKTETIVENQLTVRGKLVLSDDSVVEKRVSVVHELQNVVELACHGGTTTSPFDYGLVATHNDKKSGLVFDHTRNMFYFSTHLGVYQQNRFSLPKQYADAQARAFIAQQKVQAPFVDAHAVQCRSVRCGRDNLLMLQSPVVQCQQKLQCGSVQAELASVVRVTATTVHTHDAEISHTLHAKDTRTQTLCIHNNLRLDKMLFNTVGPNSAHHTLQDYFDACDDLRQHSPAHTECTHHAVMETSNTTHNCNAIVNHSRCSINGQHSTLTGVLELTEECETMTINDARITQWTLTSSADYTRQTARPATLTLRNVTGDAKDWCFDMPHATLRLEHCNITFHNNILGTLKKVETAFSTIHGDPWRLLSVQTPPHSK